MPTAPGRSTSLIRQTDTPLHTLLRRANLSPEQLARRLNKHAEQLRMPNRIDPKTPYKWLRGGQPRQPWPSLTAAVLTTELGHKICPDELGWRSDDDKILYVPADSGLNVPWTPKGAVDAATEITENSIMDRRIFLQLTGASLTQPALEWLIAQQPIGAENSTGRRVQPSHVENIEEITDRLRRMDDQFGGGAVIELTKSHIRFILDLIRNQRYSADVGKRLHGAAAELIRLGGWLSFDDGQHAEAQRFWLAALHCAHVAGDRALGANILGFMSCQAKDLAQFDEAIKLADAGRHGYPGASPRVTAILNLRAAEAYAQVKDMYVCQATIDAAYSAMQSSPPDSGEPSWSYWLDEAQVNEQAGYCYVKLENWSRARSHLTAAIRLQSDNYSRESALRQALLAITYARQGEPEHACEIANGAINLLTHEVDSDRCIGHVRQVQEALQPFHRTPTVREFNERVNQSFGIAA
jgi:tetratricopeptide (TPR) repeat protein